MNMRKKVKELIGFLEKETPITFNVDSISATRKLISKSKEQIQLNVLSINGGTLGLTICTKSSKNLERVVGLEVLYHDNDVLVDAQIAQSILAKALPKMPVYIQNSSNEYLLCRF
jgi:hypothetical protein